MAVFIAQRKLTISPVLAGDEPNFSKPVMGLSVSLATRGERKWKKIKKKDK